MAGLVVALKDYRFDARTGRWRHRSGPTDPDISLTDLVDVDGWLAYARRRPAAGEDALAGHLQQARLLLAAGSDHPGDEPSRLTADLEALRDFHLPAAG